MLLRHGFAYLFARGLPGLVNFAALAVYTRLLAPADYGRYSLLVAGVSMVGVVAFQWHRLVLARWLSTRTRDPQRFLGEILRVFMVLALAVAGIGLALAAVWPDPVWRRLLGLAVVLLIAQEWVELNLILAAAQLSPTRYGRILGAKTVLALALGAALASIGLGASAPMLGLIAGCVLAVPLFGLVPWRGVRPAWPARTTVREQLRYGLPLVITFALGWIITSSDRLLIAWLLDVEAAGRYAVGYDLAQNSLGVLLAIAQVAAYPLAVRALEERGQVAAQEQIRHNGELILCLAISSAAGLAVLAPHIAAVAVGAEFRETTARLLPWVALAAAIGGVKAFHLDIAFHLGRKSQGLLASAATAAALNIVLNLLLIPRFGLLGAAYATALAYLSGGAASLWLGRRVFPMPPLAPLVLRGLAVGLAVAAGGWAGGSLAIAPTPGTLLAGIAGAFIAAGVMVLCLDVADARTALWTAQQKSRTMAITLLRKVGH